MPYIDIYPYNVYIYIHPSKPRPLSPPPSGVPQSFQCLASREGHAGHEIGPGNRGSQDMARMLRWILFRAISGKRFSKRKEG